MARLTLQLNGQPRTVDAPPGATLLAVLRDQLDLIGTKYGCGEGQCGACTVWVDGRATRACLLPASDVKGAITTIEGLATGAGLHPVQQAFLDTAAFQCGFCTPGMIMGAAALLKTKPAPTDADIRQGLEGHICRCGTYPRIVAAVRLAARGGRP